MPPDTSPVLAREVPDNYSHVDPWIISADTNAEIAYLGEVFGATERPHSRVLNVDGSVGHVEVVMGDTVLLMFDRQPGWLTTPAHLRVYVEDAAVAAERALASGARLVTRPTDLAFGERVARVRDPQGHLWWIHQRLESLDPGEMTARFANPTFQAAMRYVQQSLAGELASGS